MNVDLVDDELKNLYERHKNLMGKAYNRVVAEEYLKLEEELSLFEKEHPGELTKQLPLLAFESLWMVCAGIRYDRAIYEILYSVKEKCALPEVVAYRASAEKMKEEARKRGYLTDNDMLTENGIVFMQKHEVWENS